MINKEIKNAVADVLKERIDMANYGMLSNYRASMSSRRILADNGIKITSLLSNYRRGKTEWCANS